MKAFKGMCAATGPSRRTLHRLLAALVGEGDVDTAVEERLLPQPL